MNHHRSSRRLIWALTLFSFSLWGNAANAAQTVLTYFSEPGDYIGGGQQASYGAADGAFNVSPNFGNSLDVSFNTPTFSHWWNLSFAAADAQVLVPGSYENSQRFPFQASGHPGLDFSGDGRGCNQSTGRFDILELTRDSAGQVTSLAIDFEQHCEGAAPALFGQFRYNSNVPLSPEPLHITLLTPLNSRGCVEATGPDGARIRVAASDVHDAQGGQQLSYAWTSSTGAQGNTSEFTFKAPLSLAPSNIALTVQDLTNNSSRSSTKSVCVSDTTAPRITILHPIPGEMVHEDDVVLDVQIVDAADKNITTFDADLGLHVVSALNPRSGRSRQRLQEAPKTGGPVPTTITVRVKDASGNYAEQSVSFSEVFDGHRPHH